MSIISDIIGHLMVLHVMLVHFFQYLKLFIWTIHNLQIWSYDTHTGTTVSEWLLFNANWAIFQLPVYHGENKLHWRDDNDDSFVLDKHT